MQIKNDFLKTIPKVPGCYIYKDHKGEILYIGKAVNLHNRVASYFTRQSDLQTKIQLMLKKATDIEFIVLDSEVEALILETNLIKKYKPKYNSLMKDDKSYVWVMFDNSQDFPKPEIVREKKKKNATYFGPYPQKFPATKVLRRLRKLYPYCNTNFRTTTKVIDDKVETIGSEPRPCLDYHIGLCSGVCAGLVSKTKHRNNINQIKKYFRGQKSEMKQELENKIKELAARKEYEKASKYRDQLRDLKYVTQRIKVTSELDEQKLAQQKLSIQEKSIRELFERLRLPKLTETLENKHPLKARLECYDISNIQGKNATGSMVVFKAGKPSKADYRKFKIKTKDTPDDFAMMQEVLTRRFGKHKKQDKSFSELPDLIIVDGGKGQLSSSYKIIKNLGLLEKISIVGLAKREEELFRIEEKDGEFTFKKTRLPRRSNALYLVQRIRDEAHRFAIGYHRKLRSKQSQRSILDDIPGVGDITKRRLIKAFGSWKNVKKASRKELQTVVRNRKTVDAIIRISDL